MPPNLKGIYSLFDLAPPSTHHSLQPVPLPMADVTYSHEKLSRDSYPGTRMKDKPLVPAAVNYIAVGLLAVIISTQAHAAQA